MQGVRSTACVLLLLFAVVAVAGESRAQSAPGNSYDEIIEIGTILFGVYKDFPPYSYEQDGRLVGIDVELGRVIAAELGVEPRFRAVGADENVDDDLRNNVWKGHYLGGGVVNVMLHVPYHRELDTRNELIFLTGQYFNERIGLAWSKAAYPDGAPTMASFRYDKIGVELDSLADFYLANLWGGQVVPNILHYQSTGLAMRALRDGEVGAVMGPIGQLEHGVHLAEDRSRFDSGTPLLQGLAIGEWTLGVAIRHNYRQLGYAVDDAIRAAVDDGRAGCDLRRLRPGLPRACLVARGSGQARSSL